MWKRYKHSHQSWMTVFTTSVMEWTPPFLLDFDIARLNPYYLHLNGALYWIEGRQETNNIYRRNIMCFRPYKNNFDRIALPMDQSSIKWKLSSVNNYLAIIGCSEPNEMERMYNIWIGNHDSRANFKWEKRFSKTVDICYTQYEGFNQRRLVLPGKTVSLNDDESSEIRNFFFFNGRDRDTLDSMLLSTYDLYQVSNDVVFRPSLSFF